VLRPASDFHETPCGIAWNATGSWKVAARRAAVPTRGQFEALDTKFKKRRKKRGRLRRFPHRCDGSERVSPSCTRGCWMPMRRPPSTSACASSRTSRERPVHSAAGSSKLALSV
jgi:hypothetical protein